MFAFMLVTIALIAVFVRTLAGLPVASLGLRESEGWSPQPFTGPASGEQQNSFIPSQVCRAHGDKAQI